jgi:hypothetical protein
LIDKQSAAQWVSLGRVLLLMSPVQAKAEPLAERAFRQASRLDPSLSVEIATIREEAAAEQKKQREMKRVAEAARLKTTTPEADPWPADPWPAMTEAEQQAAVLTMRNDAQKALQQVGLNVAAIETEHFVVYTDCPRTEAAAWAMKLEKTQSTLDAILIRAADELAVNPAEASPIIWGKIAVMVFSEQDKFRLVEADTFKQLVPQTTIGIAHMIGPKTFVVLHRADDDELFTWTMLHESVHALMHRYRTPRRLPAWANEGLAEFVTGLVLKDSTVGLSRRKAGLAFLRTGSDAAKIVGTGYAESDWTNAEGPALPVGALLVELLFRDKPARTMHWINAVKEGDEWKSAFEKSLRLSLDGFISTAAQYYQVND